MASIIEVTGVSCVGKSTFIKRVQKQGTVQVFSRELAAPKFLQRTHPMLRKTLGELLIWGRFCINCPLTFAQTRILFKLAFTNRERLIFRINIFRNAILKFAVRSYLQTHFHDTKVLIDEGVSHLPFVFQYSSSNLRDAASIFGEFKHCFDNCNVIILEDDNADLEQRLLERGHARLGRKAEFRVKEFVERNNQTLSEIKVAMELYQINCHSIDVSNKDAAIMFIKDSD